MPTLLESEHFPTYQKKLIHPVKCLKVFKNQHL